MVVRFPSDPFSGRHSDAFRDARADDSSAAGGVADEGHFAPVTPLRRGGTRAEGSRHPAGTGREPGREPGERAARATPVGEVVDLPGATSWNNTWADDARSGARAGAARSSAGRPVDPVSDPEADDEADRQSKKVSAVTIRQLARRGMSRWELERVLLKREIEPEVFGPELDRLETLGVIDDASLAVTLAFTQHSRKGLGRTAIEQDLSRRHIDPELIEIALADIADEDELERATELAVKRIGQLSSYDDETVRRRLHGFLARKGYASAIVRQAMDAAFASRTRGGVRFR